MGQESILAEFFDISGLRRFYSPDRDYYFSAPRDYSPDPKVVLDRLRLKETPSSIRRSALAGLPDSAVRRSGKNAIDNFSVIRAPVMEGFEMRKTLGSPENALQFLSASLAPPNSGKTIRIQLAKEVVDRETGRVSYLFEYVVDKPAAWKEGRHTWSLVTSRNNELFTLTGVISESESETRRQMVESVLQSFHLVE